MRCLFVLSCCSALFGCGDDGAPGGPSSTGTVESSTMQVTTSSADSTSTSSTSSTTTDAACGMNWDPCSRGCCAGYDCVGTADKTQVCCERGSNECQCACDDHPELDAVPEACADLQVPPSDDFNTELAGWLEDPSTIRATSHAPYYCSSVDISDPEWPDLECPCSGNLELVQLALPSSDFEVGQTTVTLTDAEASCGDMCFVDGYEGPVPFQILAVSDTCIIGETVDLRVYVDRSACP